eukprot:GHVT01082601.1.p1 GENE.GHVT01082601.1~~GHVT01082601.1.p1  ORF type:complete len:429 (-),score=40.11 GHVT01082601.1:1370-2656(-)
MQVCGASLSAVANSGPSALPKKERSLIQPLPEAVQHDAVTNAIDLAFYYGTLCPYADLVRWLSYRNDSDAPESIVNDPEFLAKREVSFALKSTTSADEIVVRWKGFRTHLALKQFVLTLKGSTVIHKLDWGAVYSQPLALRDFKAFQFYPVEREVVFDIDMDDYEEIRTCCSGKLVCKKCWVFLTVAIRVLGRALREEFKFSQILWVFSGRRGLHAWVSDYEARTLLAESRSAIGDYLTLITGGVKQRRRVLMRPKLQHPMVDSAFDLCYGYFERLLEEQEFYSKGVVTNSSEVGEESAALEAKRRGLREVVLDIMASKDVSGKFPGARVKARDSLEIFIKQTPTFSSIQFWEELCAIAKMVSSRGWNDLSATERRQIIEDAPAYFKEIVLFFSYPRLDINVTSNPNSIRTNGREKRTRASTAPPSPS